MIRVLRAYKEGKWRWDPLPSIPPHGGDWGSHEAKEVQGVLPLGLEGKDLWDTLL